MEEFRVGDRVRWTKSPDFGVGTVKPNSWGEAGSRQTPVRFDDYEEYTDFPGEEDHHLPYTEDLVPSEGDFAEQVAEILDEVRGMLLAKNAAYGNSALDPVRIFSKADTAEQLRVRIDDKISRLKRGTDYEDEDTVMDLIGYLVLLRIEESE